MGELTTTTRRRLLAGTVGLAAAAGLGACAPDGPGVGSSPSAAGTVSLPAHVPYDGVKPDLAGTAEGVAAGFFGFPQPPIERPGFPLPSTVPATALLQGTPPLMAPDQNSAYRRAREQAGNNLDATVVSSTNYLDKFQVTAASGDYPDFVHIMPVPQYPKLLEKSFTDLTDILAGDGVTKYPALANIPTATWQSASVNGRIWGVPQPRPPAGTVLSTRGDLLAKRGLDPNPQVSTGKEFVELLAALTDKRNNQFALGQDPAAWVLPLLLQMKDAPAPWSVVDGRFVSQLESEQMKEALVECAAIVQAGYTHPNSFTPQTAEWLRAGTIALYHQGFTGWGLWTRANPEWNLGIVRLPKWDGGGMAPIYKSVPGYYIFVGIRKQQDQKRLEELLTIADFIASPFGTQQFLDVNYGAAGSTYDLVDGNPTFREGQSVNVLAGWPYLGGNGQAVLFTPGNDDLTRAQHAYLSEVIPTGKEDASLGLYSETKVAKDVTYQKKFADVQRGVMQGAQPLSAWDDLVKVWKSDIGDRIAGELAEAAAAS